MLVGHEKLTETFKRLVQENKLSHSYIFFGEPQVGKFTFAKSLANYLETGEFELPSQYLNETLEIHPDEGGGIGIDTVREIKHFLSQKPVHSERRVVLIDNAETLTPQAESAILKISEEPPASALILLIVSNPDVLLPTLQSRFVKIYFGRVPKEVVEKFMIKEFTLTPVQAERVALSSFGRPGRAVEIVQNKKLKEIRADVLRLIKNRAVRSRFIRDNYNDKEKISVFISELISELSKDLESNWPALKSIYERLTLMAEFNTNRRLQLEVALWNI